MSLTACATEVPGSAAPDSPAPDSPESAGSCDAWSVYGRTLAALGVAAAFGDLDDRAVARLEVMAAASIVDAVDDIGAAWPQSLLGERSRVLAERLGPFQRRAQKALAALADAGATELDLTQLQRLWLAGLAMRTDDDPVIEIGVVPSELDALVDVAADSLDASLTRFNRDPSLLVAGLDTPRTDEYLREYCPDLMAGGMGDAV